MVVDMINKSNHYLQIKVDSKTFEFLNQFSRDFEVSISNFGEYAINSVISDLGFRTDGLSDSSVQLFLETFARNINNLYKTGSRRK